MSSRRSFLKNLGGTGALTVLPFSSALFKDEAEGGVLPQQNKGELVFSLNGSWQFRTDPDQQGVSGGWYKSAATGGHWDTVTVPHTWQITPEHNDYFGVCWYRKTFSVPGEWKGKTIRIEFEAVYHTARVWLNGTEVGGHTRKGYTAFFIDLTKAVKPDAVNTLVVMADNHFDDRMLPRNRSYDWAADGGITRPVSLHVTEPVYVERIQVTALPDIGRKTAGIAVLGLVKNASGKSVRLEAAYTIAEEETGRVVLQSPRRPSQLGAGESREISFPEKTLQQPNLWHFDHPHLYTATFDLYADGVWVHSYVTTFGIRKTEVKNAGFYLNGERVWLMGVERMGGSNPDYGMAEPGHWIEHDHRDMKELNCIFTRVHWQQDKRVLDFCDRHGILIQLEVPTWGAATFKGMSEQPDADIMQNGLEQLEEQIHREYNHPCVFSWGLCNEIGGQNPPAYHFAANMLKGAKKLDPHRLCSYASNSLQKTPEKDVSELMDFVEWNEYYESWYKGTVADMEKNLEEIHHAFPDKPIVISEYGWCRCTPDRKEGDEKLIRIMQTHNAVFRKHDYVGGLIFFCYNDYRTHVGDKGMGVMKQRVHGVVNLLGDPHPSHAALRKESSPVETLSAALDGQALKVSFTSRKAIPAYTLRGYVLRCIAYGEQGIPLEKAEYSLPDIAPGASGGHTFTLSTPAIERVEVSVCRPTAFSVLSVAVKS
ncbi:glycoside hydrolase family 2 protein [Compostibacter hankyongensis]